MTYSERDEGIASRVYIWANGAYLCIELCISQIMITQCMI